MKIGAWLRMADDGRNVVVLEIHKKELAENLAETFAKFAQDYMDDGMWEEAAECLYVTNYLNRREYKDGRTNDLQSNARCDE